MDMKYNFIKTSDEGVKNYLTRRDYTKKFFDYIYADAHLYLKRKYDVYLEKLKNVA